MTRSSLARGKRLAIAAVVFAIALPLLASAQRNTSGNTPGNRPVTPFVLGNLEYILLHELAHMLINDLDIPIIGPEENAADYIATAVLLTAEELNPVRVQRAREFLLATANALATSWEIDVETGREIRYWDTHALTIQRYYQIICLVYGSDPDTFSALPSRVGMPQERAARCPAEFSRADRSLRWLLENYGRRAGDPPGAEIEIVFEDPPTRVSQTVLESLKSSGMLGNIVARLHGTFTIATPFRIALRRCRQRQAAWLPEQRELLLCYELIDNYYLLGSQQRAAARQSILDEPAN